MTWWTSIVFYLWRNSLRRWIEQPLGLLSKLTVAGLIGALGATMILGVSYLGDKIGEQLASRDALMVSLMEPVSPRQAHAIAANLSEEAGWSKMATECLTIYQLPMSVKTESMRVARLCAVVNLESLGYPDALILISREYPRGMEKVVSFNGVRMAAIALPPKGEMIERMVGDGEVVIGSIHRLELLLHKGFTRRVLIQAKSVEAIERIDTVVDAMNAVDRRPIRMSSSLPLLLQLKEIRAMQRNIAIAVTIGSTLALGLILGALAWMEFREERYLLSLIRSFGVGRIMLFGHAVLENCIVAVAGMVMGLGGLALSSRVLQEGVINLTWFDAQQMLSSGVFGVLLFGALLGGLLSCVPVGIGLCKPLGLTLK